MKTLGALPGGGLVHGFHVGFSVKDISSQILKMMAFT